MCLDTHTEAGRVQKDSTTLDFLKAAAGNYSVTEREYKKRSKAGYRWSQSNIMHISRKLQWNCCCCLCGTGLVRYKSHDYIVPEVSIRTGPVSTTCPCRHSDFVNCFSVVHVYCKERWTGQDRGYIYSVCTSSVSWFLPPRLQCCRPSAVETVSSVGTPGGGRWTLPHMFHHSGSTCMWEILLIYLAEQDIHKSIKMARQTY